MAHNGHKGQINIVGDYPFINLLKNSTTRGWQYASGTVGGWLPPANLNTNGYPVSNLNAGGSAGVYAIVYFPPNRGGDYVAVVTGNVNDQFSVNGTTYTLTTATQRFQFTPNATSLGNGYFLFTILGIGATSGITAAAIYNLADESDYNAGQVFNSYIRTDIGNAGVVRFMQEMNTNACNYGKWGDRTPVSYWNYGGWFDTTRIGGQMTQQAGGGANNLVYTVSMPGFVLSDKAIVHIPSVSAITGFSDSTIQSVTIGATTQLTLQTGQGAQYTVGMPVYISLVTTSPAGTLANILSFNQTTVSAVSGDVVTVNVNTTGATGTYSSGARMCPMPTVNVNGTGAIAIAPMDNGPGGAAGMQPFADPFNHTDFNIYFYQQPATLFYDQSLNVWLYQGLNNSGIQSGWPPEMCVRLANDINAHPHLCIPFLAADGTGNLPTLSDYTSSLATYVKNNLNAGLIARYEVANEVWNTSFYATQYAYLRQFIREGGHSSTTAIATLDVNNWYGQAVSQVAQAIATAYGGHDKTKYHMLCGFQTNTQAGPTGGSWGDQTPRVTSPYYVSLGGSAASNWIDYVMCATYFSPGYYNGAYETTLATNYAGGDQTALATYLDSCNATSSTYNGQPSPGYAISVPGCLSIYQSFWSFAQTYTNNIGNKLGLTAYEGDYSPDTTSGNANVNKLRGDARSLAACYTFCLQNYNNFVSVGTDAVFPSLFCYAGTTGVWPVYFTDRFASNVPNISTNRWQAFVDFSTGPSKGGHSWIGKFGMNKISLGRALALGFAAVVIRNPTVKRRFWS